MFKILWHKKALFLFLAVLVILLPQSIARPAQMLSKTLLTSIGIDKVGGEYIISGEMIINEANQTGAKKSAIISAQGINIGTIINKLATSQGREISLAHCTVMVLGSGLANENLAELLKYFLNRTEINNNCALIYTDSDVKALLEAGFKEANLQGSLLVKVAEFNQENILGKPTNIEKFYKDYLRKTSTSILSKVNLNGDSIENPTDCGVFRNGKFVFSMDKTETTAFTFLNSKNTKIRIAQDNNILKVLEKSAKIETSITNDIPTAKIKVKIKTEIESDSQADIFTIASLQHLLKEKFINDIKATLLHASNKETDILGLYEKFYRTNTKKFKKYIKTRTLEIFFNELVFDINVDVEIKTL